jgi:hypothetical protein
MMQAALEKRIPAPATAFTERLDGRQRMRWRAGGPVLVDVVSARQELAMPPKTTLHQAYHFGMFMMKAVLDGRASQLIDLAKVNLMR